jgi:hypothetical protein
MLSDNLEQKLDLTMTDGAKPMFNFSKNRIQRNERHIQVCITIMVERNVCGEWRADIVISRFCFALAVS